MAFAAAPLPSIGLIIDQGNANAGLFVVNRSDFPATTATRLLRGLKLTAAVGSYALNGQDATLTKATPTPLTQPAPLPMWSLLTLSSVTNRVLVAEFGTFAINRSDAPASTATMLRRGHALAAGVGVFNVTVASAERDMELNADGRQFVVIGQAAGLSAARKLTASVGTYALNGQDSSAVIQSTTARVLVAERGIFSFMRSDSPATTATQFVRGRSLVAEAGVFSFSGQSVRLDGPRWSPVGEASGSWVYVLPSGGVWTDVDPDS